MTQRLEIREPATGEALASVALTDPAQLDELLVASSQVQALWAQLRLRDRARYLRRTAQAAIDEFDELTEIIAREAGRPYAEVATLELLSAIDTLRWLADAGERLLDSRRISLPRALYPFKRAVLGFEPAGVVAVIGAGSAPFSLPLAQTAAALLGGNSVVLKPATRASLAAERIARLLSRAGLPEGLVQVMHGGPELGNALASAHPVARVLFTGAPAGGREIAARCGQDGRGAVLECGGADTMLVLADANLQRAVGAAAWAASAGAGQLHGAVKRVLVAEEVHDRFLAQLVGTAGALRVGDPRDETTQIGPLASAARVERLSEAIEEAVADGARLRCGEAIGEQSHSLAVLSDVRPEMRVARERIPGPVIAVIAVADADQAVRLANGGERGIGASVWSADRYRAQRIARELRTGAVWINDHLPSPGIGRAVGLGAGMSVWRSQGAAGLRNCVEPKLITYDPPGGRSPWWHPYDAVVLRAARAVAELSSTREGDRERALRHGSLALARVAARAVRR